MTTIALPLESDNNSSNLENKPLPENGTDKIESNLPFPNTSEVSVSSSQSLANSNPTKSVTEGIPVTESKMTLSQEERRTTDDSEDEPNSQISTNSSADSIKIKNLETIQRNENLNSSSSSKNEIQDHFLSQKNKKDFSKADSSSNSSGNSYSQKQSQEKAKKDELNEPKIKTNDNIFDSDDDDAYASFKLNKSSKTVTKKTFAIVDSESDEDIFSSKRQNIEKEETGSVSEVCENRDTATKTKKKSRLTNILNLDSESEDETFFKSKKQNNEKEETGSVSEVSENRDVHTNTKKKSRYSNILDSESEDDSKNKEGKSQVKKSNFKKLVDSDSEDSVSAESSDDENSKSREEKKKKIQMKKTSNVLKNLVDSDDSEPDERNQNDRALSDASDENNTEGKPKRKAEKKRTGSARAAKDAAMKEIHSESQRLLRESEISLPYHRPKQRTLQEFLNRKKISSALPKAPTTAAKVKMFADLVSKAVEEKEKEVEEFYKSSDSEEEMQSVNKDTDGNEKPQTSTDQTSDLKESEKPMEVVLAKENDQQLSISLDAADILLSNNLNNKEVPQTEESIENKTRETPMESIATNNSNVSRKLFVAEAENNENSGMINHESEKDCETSVQNVENQHDAGNTDDSNAMQTDTNDFELRFSTADFDTNLQLRDLETNNSESMSSNKSVENEKSDKNRTEISEISTLIEENSQEKKQDEKMEEDISAAQKGHVVGLPPPDFDDENLPKKKLMKKIPSYYFKGKPTLRGSPGTTIDFQLDEKSCRDGVSKLVDRFVRHSQTTKSEENSDVMVMHTEVTSGGLKITEMALPYKRMNASEDSELNKPGAKLKKLREELEQKMSNKRYEEWRQKEEASKALDEYLGDEIEPEDKDELLSNEEEELDDESAESEPEENDVIIKENKRSKCEFADEEAEVSEDEENIVDEEDEENEENEEEDLEEDEDNEREYDDEDDEEKEEEEEEEKKDSEDLEHHKKLRRITTAFEDDSDLSESENPEKEADNYNEVNENPRKSFQRTKTDVDMFGDGSDGWTSDNEDEIRFKMINRTSLTCQTPVIKPNHLSLVSPITQLTALNKCSDSGKKNSASTERDSSDQMNDSLSQESNSVENRPQTSVNLAKWCGLQKKLFEDSPDAVNVDDLMDLCSGKFTGTAAVKKDLQLLMNPPTQNKVTDSQLLDLCSGSFSSVSVDKKPGKDLAVDENSQDIKLTFDEESRSSTKASPKKMEDVKLLGSRLKVVSSDEEDVVEKEEKNKKGKKKIQQLVLSDDEDENIEGTDLSDEEEKEDKEEEEEQFIDYDSEENEVVIIPKKDIKKVAKKYLENEAELSESDWDSADEDEKDLDKLEREEGDDDVIDEDQMRNQLGKIHARQVLDDDQREVRLLQDMLFEDGDLHSEGAGRERKFRWKNIDKLGADWNELKGQEDQDIIADAMEDTSEIELRKMRFEQQQFLEKQKKNSTDDIEDDLNDSPIFKVGLRVVSAVKCSTSVSKTEESMPPKPKKPLAPSIIPNLLEKPAKVKTSAINYAMRGSFLARGEETLARIASMIDEKDKVVRAPVNGRRFVFEHISPSVKDTEELKTNEEASTSKKSRKRTSTSDSTPKSAKKLKVDEERSAGKKLFSS